MVLVAALFIAVQVLALALYVTLTSYVASNRSPRSSDLPFVGFCLTQALDAATYLLFNPTDIPTGVPAVLRLRAAAAALAPAFLIHTVVALLRGRERRVGIPLAMAAYALGATGAVVNLFTNSIMAGALSSSPAGFSILRPIPTPAGYVFILVRTAVNAVLLLPLLLAAIARERSPRLRSDGRCILVPGILLLLSTLLRNGALALPAGFFSSLGPALALAHRGLSLAAGVLLAHSVFRLGSPAGQPVHHRLGPVVFAPAVAILVETVPLLNTARGVNLGQLAVPLLTGLFGGVLLSRPESLGLTDRWLGRPSPQDSPFRRDLRRAWQALAAQDQRHLSPADLCQALRREIAAAFVEILDRDDDPDDSDRLVFRARTGGASIRLPADIAWPVAEDQILLPGIQVDGFPLAVSVILPIKAGGSVCGVLVIGEPGRGGIHGHSDILQAEMLAEFLSAVHSATDQAVDHPRSALPNGHLHPPSPTPAILAFGRLQVIPPGGRPVGMSTLPLRARQLLALLLTAYPDPIPAEVLMERLWPGSAPRMSANSLYVAVWALRRALEPSLTSGWDSRYIVHQEGAYRLQVEPDLRVDLIEFEDAFHRGHSRLRSDDPEGAAREFRIALGLYRGPYLGETALDLSPEIEAIRHRLRRRCAEVARLIVQHLMKKSRQREAEELLISLHVADPWDGGFADLLSEIGVTLGSPTPLPFSPRARRTRGD